MDNVPTAAVLNESFGSLHLLSPLPSLWCNCIWWACSLSVQLTQTLQLPFCLWGFFCSVGSSWAVVVWQDILSCWGTNIFRVCRCSGVVWLEGLRQFGSIWMSGSEVFQHNIALWQDGQRVTRIPVCEATKGASRASFLKGRGRVCLLASLAFHTQQYLLYLTRTLFSFCHWRFNFSRMMELRI